MIILRKMSRAAGALACLLGLLLLLGCGATQAPPAATLLPTQARPTLTPLPSPTLPPAASPQPEATALPGPTPVELASPPAATPLPLSQAGSAPEPTGSLVAAENGGRVVSVTDELEDYPAGNLLDGYKLDQGEWWTHESPQLPVQIVFALAGDRVWAIDRVVLNPWTSDYRLAWVKDFEIYASTTSPNLEDMGWIGAFKLAHASIDQEFTFDAVYARYVALVVDSHYGSPKGITLNEFEVVAAPQGAEVREPAPPPGVTANLVAAANGGRIVDYSSQDELGNWPVDALIDGEKDTVTGWSTDTTEGLQYAILAFANDEPHWVDHVVLNPHSRRYHEDWIQEFELWGSMQSADLDAMERLGTFRLDQVDEDQEFSFDPVVLRYVALVPLSNYGGSEFSLNYHLYGAYFDDLLVTTLTNHNSQPVRLRVEASIPGYTESAVETLTLAPGETFELAQDPPLTSDALDKLHSQKDASLHVRIDYLAQGETRLVYEGTRPLTIYSRADFPWNIPGYYNGTLFMAALVMPNDPALDELMRLAADRIPGGTVSMGYGDADDSDHKVWDKMKAVYEVVSDHYNVIYVAVGTNFVPQEEQDQGFTLQRLKLPYEVLETHSGMCVELSTLFASAFEKMGLRPIIITIPSHVYIAVPISWDSDTYYVLEGTLVGRASFEEAVQVGNREFMEALPTLEADQLDSHFWLDVSEARQEGIWPIPWR